jgi:hypothetical protein
MAIIFGFGTLGLKLLGLQSVPLGNDPLALLIVIGLIALDIGLSIYALVPGIQVLPTGVHLMVGLVLFLICLGGLVWEWADWRNDIYAITDTQIIDSEKLPLGLREKTGMTSLMMAMPGRIMM